MSLLLLISFISLAIGALGVEGRHYYYKRQHPQIADPYKITAMEKELGMGLSYPELEGKVKNPNSAPSAGSIGWKAATIGQEQDIKTYHSSTLLDRFVPALNKAHAIAHPGQYELLSATADRLRYGTKLVYDYALESWHFMAPDKTIHHISNEMLQSAEGDRYIYEILKEHRNPTVISTTHRVGRDGKMAKTTQFEVTELM